MNKDVFEKIKKCLALSKSSNENEATIALKQAKLLMDRNNLTLSDVELSNINKKTLITDLKRLRFLEVKLAKMVSEVFECGFYIDGNRNFHFYGVDPNNEIAIYAYKVLVPILKKARKEYVSALHKNTKLKNKRALGNSYSLGWIQSVRSKCIPLHPNKKIEELLKKYSEEKLSLKDINWKKTQGLNKHKELEAQVAGYVDGKDVALYSGMKNKEYTLIEPVK